MERAETWQETTAFWTYRTLARVAPVVPEGVGHALTAAVGTLAHRRLARLQAIVAANQARVLALDPGDERVRRSTRDAFRLYARYWYDTFRLRSLAPAALGDRIDPPDLRQLDEALARGKGCILVLPHLGNWDVAGRFLAINRYRVAAVAENLRPARLAALFRHHREELGIRIVPLVHPMAVYDELKRLLAENWIVALLADRSLSRRGIEVEMFGATRVIPVGPALLSLATGASLFVAAAYTMPSGWRLRLGPVLEIERNGDRRADVRALSHLIAAELERAIAIHPADWHFFEPAWGAPSSPPKRRARMRRTSEVSAAVGRP